MRLRLIHLTCLLALASVCSLAGATESSPLFPFVIPWDDSSSGASMDVSFLNAKPAGVNGYIVVRNGHFVESQTGKRIRFLGVNITWSTLYLDHADAAKVAAHLAKLGINIVRIHRHDAYQLPLWSQSSTDHSRFDPEGLDKLDYLIAELKKNGIYVDLNLHVSRTYGPEDGFPDSVKDLSEPNDKRIDYIDRHMIELQKQFAREYLTHLNPYTGLSYVDDPAVAIVEINNEDAFSGGVRSDEQVDYFSSLPKPFQDEVVQAWNDYLLAKYHSTANLTRAWTAGQTPGTGSNAPGDLMSASSIWRLNDRDHSGAVSITGPGTASTMPAADVVFPAGPQSGQRQLLVNGLDLIENGVYVLTLRAKSDRQRIVNVNMDLDQPDWHDTGRKLPLTVGPDWRSFRFAFQATRTVPGHCRLKFILPAGRFTLSLADVALHHSATSELFESGQTLESRNIGLPNLTTSEQTDDWRRFLVDTDTAYATMMRNYVRNDLKSHANIIDTQISYGKLAGLMREAGSDFIDSHAYWQYMHFPTENWDSARWQIPKTPMTDSLASGKGGTLGTLDSYRIAGKPFTVSEYNHLAPSDYQAEMYPEIISNAALQDWDAVILYTYGERFTGRLHDYIQDWFAVQGDPAKEAFMPAAALILRENLIAPYSSRATLHLPASAPYSFVDASDQWTAANIGKRPSVFGQRMEMMLDPSVTKPSITTSGVPSSGSGARAITTPGGSEYIASGEGAIAAAGFFGGQTFSSGPLSMTLPAFGNNFASLTLTPLDGKPLAASTRLLLTICGRAENTDMGWNEDRTSVGANWGHGPVLVEGIPASVTIANALVGHVWALDPTGVRARELPATVAGGKIAFQIGPENKTVWYEIVR